MKILIQIMSSKIATITEDDEESDKDLDAELKSITAWN